MKVRGYETKPVEVQIRFDDAKEIARKMVAQACNLPRDDAGHLFINDKGELIESWEVGMGAHSDWEEKNHGQASAVQKAGYDVLHHLRRMKEKP